MTKDDQIEPGKDNTPLSLSEPDRLALQVHLAEYQALMARNTAELQWQWALIPAVAVILGVTASAWDRLDHRLLVWAAAAAIQAIIAFAYMMNWDMYNNIVYIETELRHNVQTILRKVLPVALCPSFLAYESYQLRQRGKGPLLPEWGWALCALILVVVIATTRYPFSTWDWVGLILNVLILVYLGYKAYSAFLLRRRWCAKLKELSCQGATANET